MPENPRVRSASADGNGIALVPAERRRFIIRHGVLRYGVPLGLAVFAWVIRGEYATSLDHLQTTAGWLRLALLLVLCIAEWVVGAGWLIGMGLWYLREHPMSPTADRDGAAGHAGRGGADDH